MRRDSAHDMLLVKGFTGLSTPYARCTSFRIAAPITTIVAFPRARRRCPKARMSGFDRNAAMAGQYSALRTRALPIFDRRERPRTLLPDSWCCGVRPVYAAAWRADWNRPSGAISANRRVGV